jgi:hypothetical protein
MPVLRNGDVRADVPRRSRASERSGPNFWAGTIPGFVLMVVEALLNGLCGMDWADYLRDQATMYRQLAEQTDDPAVQNEMLELASVCEEVANNMEDHLTGG